MVFKHGITLRERRIIALLTSHGSYTPSHVANAEPQIGSCPSDGYDRIKSCTLREVRNGPISVIVIYHPPKMGVYRVI